jgi:hypothetical protein
MVKADLSPRVSVTVLHPLSGGTHRRHPTKPSIWSMEGRPRCPSWPAHAMHNSDANLG